MIERTYSEEEMAKLLERAAKLQAKAARHAESRPGLTFSELETIASEAGLDPLHLRQAARELYQPDIPIAHRKVTTSATHNYVDQWVLAELTDDSWEEIVSELRHRYESNLGQMMGGGEVHGKGLVTQIGRSKEWAHTSMSGIETRVIVQPRGESLQVKLSQRVGLGGTLTESIMYGMIISIIAALIAGKVAASGMIGVLTMVGVLLAVAPLVFYADKAWRKKKHKELEELADQLAGILSNHPPVQLPGMTYEDEGTSRIDASLLDGEDVYEEKKGARLRERE